MSGTSIKPCGIVLLTLFKPCGIVLYALIPKVVRFYDVHLT